MKPGYRMVALTRMAAPDQGATWVAFVLPDHILGADRNGVGAVTGGGE